MTQPTSNLLAFHRVFRLHGFYPQPEISLKMGEIT